MTLFTRISNSLLSIAVAMLFAIQGHAQLSARDFGNSRGRQSQNRDIFGHAHDSIDGNTVPKGLFVWNVDHQSHLRWSAGFYDGLAIHFCQTL